MKKLLIHTSPQKDTKFIFFIFLDQKHERGERKKGKEKEIVRRGSDVCFHSFVGGASRRTRGAVSNPQQVGQSETQPMGGLRSGRDRITQQIWRPQQPSIPHRHSHRHSPPPSSSTPVPASFAPPSPSPQSLLHQEHTTDSSTSTEAMACAAAAAAVSSGLSSLASSKSGLNGVSVAVSAPRIAPATARSFAVRASKSEESETVSRRAALALVAGVVAAGARIAPANAAYGESGELLFCLNCFYFRSFYLLRCDRSSSLLQGTVKCSRFEFFGLPFG